MSEESVLSTASTIPYVDEQPYVIQLSTSTSTIFLDSSDDNDDDDDDVPLRSLETHFYVADRPPAPYSESFHEEEVTQPCNLMNSIFVSNKSLL